MRLGLHFIVGSPAFSAGKLDILASSVTPLKLMYNPVEALGRPLELRPLNFAHFRTLPMSRADYLPAQVAVHLFPWLMAYLPAQVAVHLFP